MTNQTGNRRYINKRGFPADIIKYNGQKGLEMRINRVKILIDFYGFKVNNLLIFLIMKLLEV